MMPSWRLFKVLNIIYNHITSGQLEYYRIPATKLACPPPSADRTIKRVPGATSSITYPFIAAWVPRRVPHLLRRANRICDASSAVDALAIPKTIYSSFAPNSLSDPEEDVLHRERQNRNHGVAKRVASDVVTVLASYRVYRLANVPQCNRVVPTNKSLSSYEYEYR